MTTQPKFKVLFKEDAILAIQKQERGEVLLILEDDTKDIDRVTYTTLGDVSKDDYDTGNYDLITLAFMGNPSKVTVIKAETETADTLAKLGYYNNYILVYPTATAELFTVIQNYINKQWEANNYCIAVLGNATAPDSQYIVNFTTDGIKANVNGQEKEFSAGDYTARVAGALSGLASSRSLTYYELPEIIDCTLSATPDADAGAGKLIILHQDGSFKFGRAINSLTTLTDGVTEAFKSIRIVYNILGAIGNDVVTTFRTGYVGKYQNTYANKLRFCGAITSYLGGLVEEGLLDGGEEHNKVVVSYEKNRKYLADKGVDVNKLTYNEILQANTGTKVLLDGVCSPTDTMEDLDIVMYLFQNLEA